MPMMEVIVPRFQVCQRRIQTFRDRVCVSLVHLLRAVENPIPASTHIAHVLKP